MYPTLAGLAGAPLAKTKPLDGVDVWPTISEGRPSPRAGVVYDVEPFRAAVRKGPWKLIWQATLPSKVELFDVVQDPSEKRNLADANPSKVAELQEAIQQMAREAVPPLIMKEIIGSTRHVLFGSVVFPEDDKAVEAEP
jgi:arylsulfatase A-like enzyme